MSVRLGIFVTHPIQYFAPIYRRLAAEPGIAPKVHFFSDCSIRGEIDPGFGVPVAWDVPLLEGYESIFLDREADRTKYRQAKIADVDKFLRTEGFDWVMIHGYTYPFERQLPGAARRQGIRTLIRGDFTDHATRPWWKTMLRKWYLQRFYSQLNVFGYPGVNGREHLTTHGVPENRMYFSPYSVDTTLIDKQRETYTREESRNSLGISDDRLVLLFSGKLIPRKNPLLLIEAIRRLPTSENVHLIMLGDGPMKAEVEAAAQEVLGSRLTMPGFVNQSQLGQYFVAADVFVLPAVYDSWGLVVNEALQFGLPVVVSSMVGSHRDLVIPGETGYVFKSGDADDLKNQLTNFLDDTSLASRMGDQGMRHVQNYSTEASAQGILAALRHSA